MVFSDSTDVFIGPARIGVCVSSVYTNRELANFELPVLLATVLLAVVLTVLHAIIPHATVPHETVLPHLYDRNS